MKKVLKSKKFIALALGTALTGAAIIGVAAACAAKISVVENSVKYVVENSKTYLTLKLSDNIEVSDKKKASVVYEKDGKSTFVSLDNGAFDKDTKTLKIEVKEMPTNQTKVVVVADGIKFNYVYESKSNSSNENSSSEKDSGLKYSLKATLNENNRPNIEFIFESNIPKEAMYVVVTYVEKNSSKKPNDSEKIQINADKKFVWDSYAWDAGKTYVVSNVKFFNEKEELINSETPKTIEVSVPAMAYKLNLDTIKNAAKNPSTWNSYVSSLTFDADFAKSSTNAKEIIDPAIKAAVATVITNQEEKKLYDAVSKVVNNIISYDNNTKTLRIFFGTEVGTVDVSFNVDTANKSLTYKDASANNNVDSHDNSNQPQPETDASGQDSTNQQGGDSTGAQPNSSGDSKPTEGGASGSETNADSTAANGSDSSTPSGGDSTGTSGGSQSGDSSSPSNGTDTSSTGGTSTGAENTSGSESTTGSQPANSGANTSGGSETASSGANSATGSQAGNGSSNDGTSTTPSSETTSETTSPSGNSSETQPTSGGSTGQSA